MANFNPEVFASVKTHAARNKAAREGLGSIFAEKQKKQEELLESVVADKINYGMQEQPMATKAVKNKQLLNNINTLTEHVHKLIVGKMLREANVVELEGYSDIQLYEAASEFLTKVTNAHGKGFLPTGRMNPLAFNSSSTFSPADLLQRSTNAIAKAMTVTDARTKQLKADALPQNFGAIDMLQVDTLKSNHPGYPEQNALFKDVVEHVRQRIAGGINKHDVALQESVNTPLDETAGSKMAMALNVAKHNRKAATTEAFLETLYKNNRVTTMKDIPLNENAEVSLTDVCMNESVFQLLAVETFRTLGLITESNEQIQANIQMNVRFGANDLIEK